MLETSRFIIIHQLSLEHQKTIETSPLPFSILVFNFLIQPLDLIDNVDHNYP